MTELVEEIKVDAGAVLAEICKLVFVNVQALFDDEGRLLPIHMMPEHVTAAISSVEVVTRSIPGSNPVEVQHTSKIKFWDKLSSLELLARHKKLLTGAPQGMSLLQFVDELPDP